ncbi:MAG: FG-GAP-like repeat-containing protein [Acidobacteriota bacterium]
MPKTPMSVLAAIGLLTSAIPLFAGPVPFQSPTTIIHQAGARGGVAADIDRDDDLDWVSAAAAGGITWYDNDRLGTWTAQTIDASFAGHALAVADIDRDAWPDLVAVSDSGDGLVWFENPGATGSWTENPISATGGSWVTVADLDRDGDIDVIAGAPATWYENTGGAWTARALPASVASVAGVAADIDRDGWLDLVTGGGDGATSVVFWRSSASAPPSYTKNVVTGSLGEAAAVDVGDIDRDGTLDVAVADATGDTIAWYELVGPTDADWAARTIDAAINGASSVQLTDLDFDGDLDVLGAARDGQSVAWWENEGGTWTRNELTTGAAGLGRARAFDADKDGDFDVLFEESAVGARLQANISLHRSLEPFWNPIEIDVPQMPRELHAGDFDRDGDLDLVMSNQDRTNYYWIENDGTPDDGGWTQHLIDHSVAPDSAVLSALLDVDRDGDLDLLAPNRWIENDGTPTDGGWVARTIDSTGVAFSTPIDVDRDGDPDLLGAVLGELVLFVNDGTPADGAWQRIVVQTFPTSAGIPGFAVHDVDRDGDPDITLAASTRTWLENDGSPLSGPWASHPLPESSNVTLCDFDADGDLDSFGRSDPQDALTAGWFENEGSFPWAFRSIPNRLGGSLIACLDFDRDGDRDIAQIAIDPLALDLPATYVLANPGGDATGPWEQSVPGIPGESFIAEDVGDFNGDGQVEFVWGNLQQIVWDPTRAGHHQVAPRAEVDDGVLVGGWTDVPLWRLDAEHRGRAEDAAILLESLSIGVIGLDDSGLDSRFDAIELWIGDADNAFEPGSDETVLVSVAPPFSLASGLLEIPLPAANPGARLEVGTPFRYWLTVDVRADAATTNPDTFELTFQSSTSRGVMDGFGIALDAIAYPEDELDPLSINLAPTLDSPIDDQTATVGTPFLLDVAASFTEPQGEQLVFSATGLPSSLGLSPDGLLSGLPSSLDARILGPDDVQVTATDPLGATASASFQLTVVDDPSVVLVDGFESGDLAGWSSSTP